MNVEIRLAKREESEQISELCSKQIKKYVSINFSKETELHLMDFVSAKSFEDYISQEEHLVFIAYHKSKVLGVCAIKGLTHIYAMYVDEEYCNQGIARELCNYTIKAVSNLGNKGIVTLNSSEYAVEFYKKLNFRSCGAFETKNGVKSLPMELKLNS